MKKCSFDTLYSIFETHLLSAVSTESSEEELIQTVAFEYIEHLLSVGHIPDHVLGKLIEDVEEEVTEMYRKKTYGSFNLQDFGQKLQSAKQRIRPA